MSPPTNQNRQTPPSLLRAIVIILALLLLTPLACGIFLFAFCSIFGVSW